MVYVFLANGFEEIEALTPVDFLLRAGVDVKTVGVDGKFCRGSHGINIEADIVLEDAVLDGNLKCIILPGGMPGAKNLNESAGVQKAIDFCAENDLTICAICAAPFILGGKGLLKGKNATCYPGFEHYLDGACVKEWGVVTDGNIITGKGPAFAWEFSCEICKKLTCLQKAEEIMRGIQWKK